MVLGNLFCGVHSSSSLLLCLCYCCNERGKRYRYSIYCRHKTNDVSAHRDHAKRLPGLALHKAMPTTSGEASCGALRGGVGSSLPIASPGDVKYCVCQAPAHGKMVSCDNETCLVGWFYLSCVGLKEPPKMGKWYCPECFDLLGDPEELA